MTLIWDTSNEAIEEGDYAGIAKLTILTSILQFLPIFLVYLLPNTKEEQKKLRDDGETYYWGGFNLGITVIVSFVFTVGLNLYLLVT